MARILNIAVTQVPYYPGMAKLVVDFRVDSMQEGVDLLPKRIRGWTVTSTISPNRATLTFENMDEATASHLFGKFHHLCMAGNPLGPIDLEALVWGDDDATPKIGGKKIFPLCNDCSRELSPELDAYYGSDPVLANLCDRCRRKRKGRK